MSVRALHMEEEGGDGSQGLEKRRLSIGEKVGMVRTKIAKGPDWTPPEDDAKLQGWRHDLFNVLALPFVIACIVANLDFVNEPWTRFWWTGNYHWALWGVTMAYFVTDLVWVILVPVCVKSPGVIWIHHIVTMFYLVIPFVLREEASWFMGACLLVEVNTWFLIMRRFANKENIVPWSEEASAFTSIRIQFVVFMFYVTWIGIRLIIYPVILPLVAIAYFDYAKDNGYLNPLLPAPFAQLCFIALNLKWSKDLFFPPKREAGPSRGL